MQIKKDALNSQFLKQHANCSQIVGKTDWQRAGRLILFNLPAEYFFVAGQSKLAMIGLGIISSWCVWVKTGCAAYILLRLGSHQRRNIIQNLEHRWKKKCFVHVSSRNTSGWWLQTWVLFSISFMGCHPNPIDFHSIILQDGYCTTNQYIPLIFH